MRNLVINCNVLVSDDFDEEKAIESVTGAFIFNLGADMEFTEIRINDITDSVIDQIPPLPKEHLGWEAPDRSEILAIDKDYVLINKKLLTDFWITLIPNLQVSIMGRCGKQRIAKVNGSSVGLIIRLRNINTLIIVKF